MSYQKLLQQMIGMALVLLLLVACGAPAPTPTPIPPTPTPVPPTPTPTLTATTGQVKGVLVDKDTQQPVVVKNLHLPIAEETASGVSLHFGGDDPRTETDDSGAFLFEDVPPGKYGLTATFGFMPSPLTDDEGAIIVFKVTVGQVIDLGTIPVKTK